MGKEEELKQDVKTINFGRTNIDYLRAIYAEVDHIPITTPMIRIVFRKSDIVETPMHGEDK